MTSPFLAFRPSPSPVAMAVPSIIHYPLSMNHSSELLSYPPTTIKHCLFRLSPISSTMVTSQIGRSWLPYLVSSLVWNMFAPPTTRARTWANCRMRDASALTLESALLFRLLPMFTLMAARLFEAWRICSPFTKQDVYGGCVRAQFGKATRCTVAHGYGTI